MKTIATINEQDAVVTSVSMNRASGYGQYTINIQFTWNGEDFNTNVRSTDSRAFDNMNDADDTMEFLLEEFANTIEGVVGDLVSESIVKSGQDEEL